MHHRSVLATFSLICLALLPACLSSTQISKDIPPSAADSTPSTPETVPAQGQTNTLLDPGRPEQPEEDAVTEIRSLRHAIHRTPERTDLRLKLAERLSRFGDLDAALDECRAVIALHQNDAKAHMQLGVLLMARQEWQMASASLQNAVRLDSTLTQAHYNLGSVHYALGNVTAAMQSYRNALTLQPDFPDARYRLALLLKLTNHEREAAQFMDEAAIGGVPQAQYFLGNAYKQGLGVEKNLPRAIVWWAKAASLGYQPAAEAMSKLRRQSLAADQPERRRQDIADAFRQYRHQLWEEQAHLTKQDPDQSLGITLLGHNQLADGIAMLLAETYALSEPALTELARLYEIGAETGSAQFDRRIRDCFDTTAADGFPPAKKILARMYAKGVGVERDRTKARLALKGLPKQDIHALIDELGLH
ncbi:MAG: sel1 repeat family protein [Nitrospira sp.]|nr:sel1 repeat family protein [Nitrospira sp.]